MPTFTYNDALHEYRLDEDILPSVTAILKAEGFVDDSFYTEESRLRGEYVHRICHLWDINDLFEDSVDAELLPYFQAYRRFLSDTGFNVITTEKPLYHPMYRYAGTPDKDGILNGKETIIDIKTGAVQDWAGLQLAAYQELIGSPRQRYGLQLMPNGMYKLTPFKDRQDRQIWLSALACYLWKRSKK